MSGVGPRLKLCFGLWMMGMILFSAPASALPLSASFGLGGANPAAADPVGYAGVFTVCASFDDSFGGYASVWRVEMPSNPEHLEADYGSVTAFSAGVEYRLSVAEMEPFLKAGGGVVGARGSDSASAPMVEFGLGARWLLSRDWMLGFELGRFAPMDELGGVGGGGLFQIQATYRFEL